MGLTGRFNAMMVNTNPNYVKLTTSQISTKLTTAPLKAALADHDIQSHRRQWNLTQKIAAVQIFLTHIYDVSWAVERGVGVDNCRIKRIANDFERIIAPSVATSPVLAEHFTAKVSSFRPTVRSN